MKILVAMKQTVDLQQIRIKDNKPLLNDVPMTFGRIDRNALEAGVQIKESHGGEVIVVSAGNEELEDTIKEALAADADSAVLLCDKKIDEMDSAQTAIVLTNLIKKISDYDLIIFGEGSSDNYSGLMGSRIAEMLDLPQVGFASNIVISEGVAKVTRTLEECDEIVEVDLPAVINVIGDLNEPRIPAVTKVLKAGRKPKELHNLEDLLLNAGEDQVITLSNLAPVMDRKRIQVKTVQELIDAIKAEGLGRI